jgi:hypothetical protein
MVWLYRSPIQWGREAFYSVQIISTCLRGLRGRGGGFSTRGLTIEAIGWRSYSVAMHVCYEVHEEEGGGRKEGKEIMTNKKKRRKSGDEERKMWSEFGRVLRGR